MANRGFLQQARAAIDELDDQLLALLARRGELAQQVALTKQADSSGEVVYYRPEREAEVLHRVSRNNPGPYPGTALRSIYREVISSTLALEQRLSVAVVTDTERLSKLAARNQFGFFAMIRSFPSAELAVEAVTNGDVDLVLIAIEDSASGLLAEPLRSVMDRGLFPVTEVVEYTGEPSEAQGATRFLAMGRMSCEPTGLDRTLLVVTGDRELDPAAGLEDGSVRATFLDSGGRDESDAGRWVVMINGHFKDEVTAATIANLTVRRDQVTVIGSWPVVEQSPLDG